MGDAESARGHLRPSCWSPRPLTERRCRTQPQRGRRKGGVPSSSVTRGPAPLSETAGTVAPPRPSALTTQKHSTQEEAMSAAQRQPGNGIYGNRNVAVLERAREEGGGVVA